jgi:hypothetical protein
VLRKLFLPIRLEVSGDWRMLNSEELHDVLLRFRVFKLRSMSWTVKLTVMVVRTGVCRGLVGKHKSKRQLGKDKRKWDFNTKRGIMEIFWKAWTALILM